MQGAVSRTSATEVTKRSQVAMRLRDGTQLVSDIYSTPGSAPAPALLMRQPYGRSVASTVVYAQPEFFARQGFVVVIQDVRGRGESEGIFEPFHNEAEDGIETINWVASLDECDGRVCMYGFSYQAYTQLAVLKNRPTALTAIAPHMSAADLHSGWFYKSGILRLSTTLSWGNQMLREDAWRLGKTELASALEASWRAPGSLLSQLPIVEAQPLCHSDAPGYVSDWLTHEPFDEFWKELDTTGALAQSDIPVFHLAGYYDYYLDGSLAAYQSRANTGKDFFLLSPWKHIPWERWIAGHDLGPEAQTDTDQLLSDWFKKQLGLPTNQDVGPGVKYFTMGANEWNASQTWPPRADETTFFLQSLGRANGSGGDGILTENELSDSERIDDVFVSDPQVPVLAPGGMTPTWGPADLRDQQQGNNLLVYSSEPFSRTTTVTGEPTAEIYISADVVSIDLFGRLSWVRRDGSALFICLAVTEVDCSGNQPIRVVLKFGACSIEIAEGESLRLDIAGQAFPLFARNPQNGVSRLQVKRPIDYEIARIHLHHATRLPSRLILPTTT